MHAEAGSNASADGGAIKCLIVDDVDENLVALSALLGALGVEVLQARSGVEALELLLVHEVALALLDVQMPEMDGFELAELMRGSERTRRVPIIFVTAGQHDQQRIFKGYESGAVDFLFKPIEPQVLRSKATVFFQLHRQNRQLATQLKSLTETLRLNEMFTAVLGHDLRGPLATLKLSSQLLARRPDEEIQKAASRMLRSCDWMGRMIEDLLDLSRARVGTGITIARRPCDLGEIVDRVVQDRETAFPDRRIAVMRRGDTRGEWDGDRIAQVVYNLVGNALVHGAPSSPIDISLDGSSGTTVLMTVRNRGVIPAELRPHIFDPFRSGRQTSDRNDGLGLGLYIVEQIVQAHGGHVHLSVDPDAELTSFVVELGRAPA